MPNRALVIIDIQNEYVTPDRPFHIKSIDSSLSKAADVLAHARALGWPVVHVQHLQEEGIFKRGTAHAAFIAGFQPLNGETLVEKQDFSSFSAAAFVEFAATHNDKTFVVIGYGSTMCCLATIVDGYHRGYRFEFIRDASAAKSAGGRTEQSMHDHAATILATYSTVIEARELFASNASDV